MSTVLLRHFPELAPALRGVDNAFAPWKAVPTMVPVAATHTEAAAGVLVAH